MGEAKRKKDLGILPNGLREETRDRLAKRNWQEAPKLDPLNPNHWTTRECEEKEFSGWRFNPFTTNTELWLKGRMLEEINATIVAINPLALDEIYKKHFAVKDVEFCPPPDERN